MVRISLAGSLIVTVWIGCGSDEDPVDATSTAATSTTTGGGSATTAGGAAPTGAGGAGGAGTGGMGPGGGGEPPTATTPLGVEDPTCTDYVPGVSCVADQPAKFTAGQPNAGTEAAPNIITDCDFTGTPDLLGSWIELQCVKIDADADASAGLYCGDPSGCENIVLDRVTFIGSTSTSCGSTCGHSIVKLHAGGGAGFDGPLRSMLIDKSDFYNGDQQIYCLGGVDGINHPISPSLVPSSRAEDLAVVVRNSRFSHPALTWPSSHVELIYTSESCNGLLVENSRLDCTTGYGCGSGAIQIQHNTQGGGNLRFRNNHILHDDTGQLINMQSHTNGTCPTVAPVEFSNNHFTYDGGTLFSTGGPGSCPGPDICTGNTMAPTERDPSPEPAACNGTGIP